MQQQSVLQLRLEIVSYVSRRLQPADPAERIRQGSEHEHNIARARIVAHQTHAPNLAPTAGVKASRRAGAPGKRGATAMAPPNALERVRAAARLAGSGAQAAGDLQIVFHHDVGCDVAPQDALRHLDGRHLRGLHTLCLLRPS